MIRLRLALFLNENFHLIDTSSKRILYLITQILKGLPDDIVLGTYHTHEPGDTVLLAYSDDF